MTIPVQIHTVTYLSIAFVCCYENYTITLSGEGYRFLFQTRILGSSLAVLSSDNSYHVLGGTLHTGSFY